MAASIEPPRAPSLEAPVPAGGSCAAITRRVVPQHPRIEAARARARAALARSTAEGFLPPPRASVEVWDFPISKPEMIVHEGMYMFGVGQEFPAPGLNDARARVEAEEAAAHAASVSEASRQLGAEIARSCTDWSAAQLVHERLKAHRSLLVEMKEAMLARYQTGGESLGAIRRADAELAAAERQVAEAEEELAVTRATLAALIGPGLQLPMVPPPLVATAPADEVAALMQLAVNRRGDASAAQARRRSADARFEAISKEATLPSFEARLTWMQTPGMRPGLGAMVSMSLPWLWSGGHARRESGRHEVEAAVADAADLERSVRVEVTRAAGQLKALTRGLRLLTEREIPAAQSALETERGALIAGDFNLASWIQAARALREAQVDEARMRAGLARAQIELDFSIGRQGDDP